MVFIYFPLADIFQGDGRVWRVVSVGSRESVMETFWRLGVGLVVHPGQVCMAGLGSCCVDSAHYISTNWLALCTLLIKLAATGRLCLESSTNVHIGKHSGPCQRRKQIPDFQHLKQVSGLLNAFNISTSTSTCSTLFLSTQLLLTLMV